MNNELQERVDRVVKELEEALVPITEEIKKIKYDDPQRDHRK